MRYLFQFLILIAFSFIGELLRHIINLPIPPSVYGLILLFICLQTKLIKLHQIKQASDFLIQIMPLLFIPSGVGLMNVYMELLPISKLLGFVFIVIFVTIIVMTITGKTADHILKRTNKK